MAFLSLLVYSIALLLRPHEWGMLASEPSTIVRNSLLFCAVLFTIHKNKNFRVPQLPLMTILLLTVFMSVAANGWVGGGVIEGEQFLQTAMVPFLLISGLVDSLRKQQILFIVVMATSLFTVFNGHIQTASEFGIGLVGNSLVVDGGNSRITYLGFLSDPNDLGMYLLMSLPLFFYFKETSTGLARPLSWCAIIAILYGVTLTNSRGTLLGLLALIAFWFWRKYGTTKTVIWGLASSPALLLILANFRAISSEDASSQGRLEAWYSGLQMLISNPVFGVGRGNFMNYHDQTAHNSFVLAFAEMGIIGCLAWVAILAVSIVSLINIAEKKYLRVNGPLSEKFMLTANQESRIAQAMLYSFLAFFVTGFFLSRTYVPLLYFYLGMSAACLGRVLRAYPMVNLESICPSIVAIKITLVTTFGGIVALYIIGKLFL